jgi:hypothetical protein
MSAYFPRTEILLINSMSRYQQSLKRGLTAAEAGAELSEHIGLSIVSKLDAVLSVEPVLPERYRAAVYGWLKVMPGFEDAESAAAVVEAAFQRKTVLRLL